MVIYLSIPLLSFARLLVSLPMFGFYYHTSFLWSASRQIILMHFVGRSAYVRKSGAALCGSSVDFIINSSHPSAPFVPPVPSSFVVPGIASLGRATLCLRLFGFIF